VTAALQCYLDNALGDHVAITVTPMVGGGSCEVFAIDRGPEHWVLRRAPRHASSATAHDVLREFRILDSIKDESVAIARPIVACDDPEVFGSPFYVMERIDGRPILQAVPDRWAAAPASHGRALEELIDALVAVHAVDWRSCGLEDLAHPGNYLSRQRTRWLTQLGSYGGRDLPAAHRISDWLEAHRPVDQPSTLCHGDYKLDNVLFAPDAPPRLLAVVDWEMAAIGDPLVDLAWALVFLPGPEGTIPLGMSKEPTFDVAHLPGRASLVEPIWSVDGHHRLVRRVRPLEAGHRSRRQLREVPPGTLRQADARVFRRAGRRAARRRDRPHRPRRGDMTHWAVLGSTA
jgi:aminoglycoside phosphotransferase (APT) family kinase protein